MKHSFRLVGLGALKIPDERAMREVPLYLRLKQVLVRDGYRFRIAEGSSTDRARFLNLTFWGGDDAADVIVGNKLPADVVAHAAWHHLARRALGAAGGSAHGMLLGESVASAWDLYLVGRLLRTAPRTEFLTTQVPAMEEACRQAGLGRRAFAALLLSIAGDAGQAFADLRQLLFVVTTRLLGARGIEPAAGVLASLAGHRFHPLLHHYDLSTWILYARAFGARPDGKVPAPVARVDRAIAANPDALDWLERHWLEPTAS